MCHPRLDAFAAATPTLPKVYALLMIQILSSALAVPGVFYPPPSVSGKKTDKVIRFDTCLTLCHVTLR
jgi:hypothetical protein